MALTARARRAIPNSSVVYGTRSRVGGKGRKAYPINTPKRARAALAYSARADTAGSYATVERAVNRRYPQIRTRHHTPQRRR
jgi:hypothetical protein